MDPNTSVTVHRVQIPPRTPEQEAADAAWKAENAARAAAMNAEALDFRCPTCKVGPQTPCVWRRRHYSYEVVHAPRIYRTPTWKSSW